MNESKSQTSNESQSQTVSECQCQTVYESQNQSQTVSESQTDNITVSQTVREPRWIINVFSNYTVRGMYNISLTHTQSVRCCQHRVG